MGKPCKVTFEGKTFFKPDFIKRVLDTLHLEDDVVANSTYLKSIGYDNAFNEGDPMLIREKKAEAKAEAKEQAKEETKKSEEKIFTYDKDGNIVEATVIAKGKNTTSVLIDGKQTTRANTELFNNKEDAQARLSETEERSIFDDFDASNKRGGIRVQQEAKKAFAEKYGEDAAVAKAISSNFEAIADELKAKGIFTKIEC